MKQQDKFTEMHIKLTEALPCDAQPDAMLVQRVKLSALRGEPVRQRQTRRIRVLAVALALALLFCAGTVTLAATGALDGLNEEIRARLQSLWVYEYDANREVTRIVEYKADGSAFVMQEGGVSHWRSYDYRRPPGEQEIVHTFEEGDANYVYDDFGNLICYERTYYDDGVMFRRTEEYEYAETATGYPYRSYQKSVSCQANGSIESWDEVFWNADGHPVLENQYRGESTLVRVIKDGDAPNTRICTEYSSAGNIIGWTIDEYESYVFDDKLMKSTEYNADGSVKFYSLFTYREFPLSGGGTEWKEVRQMVYHGNGSLLNGFEMKYAPIENYHWATMGDGEKLYETRYVCVESVWISSDGQIVTALFMNTTLSGIW
ncbi:MAG: hypothetical protein FWF10_09025 [Clostridiales bacterium]|nr:hypothetical protein [Clostridiales bacterium]